MEPYFLFSLKSFRIKWWKGILPLYAFSILAAEFRYEYHLMGARYADPQISPRFIPHNVIFVKNNTGSVREYLLFIDTETSGLPDDWGLPYSAAWPYTLQMAWVIYSGKGVRIKQENHYFRVPDRVISADAMQIHGITPEFLRSHGEDPVEIMKRFTSDLTVYNPVIVGHFTELDIKMAGAEFHRTNLENVLSRYPIYCTMQASRHLSNKKFLRLGDLYEQLFHQPLHGQHNALADADATAACFFEMRRRNEISEDEVERQQIVQLRLYKPLRRTKRILLIFLLLLLTLLITVLL